jgi:hypothetical protein
MFRRFGAPSFGKLKRKPGLPRRGRFIRTRYIYNDMTEKDDLSQDERYRVAYDVLAELFESYGFTPTEAVDYLAIEKRGSEQKKWAEVRDVSASTVSRNLTDARRRVADADRSSDPVRIESDD